MILIKNEACAGTNCVDKAPKWYAIKSRPADSHSDGCATSARLIAIRTGVQRPPGLAIRPGHRRCYEKQMTVTKNFL